MSENLKALVLNPADMDESARPQDDFYRYINGNWIDNHKIPADRASSGAFYDLRDLSEENCHIIVKDAVEGKIEDEDAEKIAIIFSQFMDEGNLNSLGATPVVPFLAQIFTALDHKDLAKVAGDLAKMGISSFFSEAVETDLNDSTRYIYYLNQAGLGLPDESYYREEQYEQIREKYQQYIANMFTLGDVVPPAQATEAASEVFNFETELASLHWDVVRNRDIEAQNNPRTWAEVKTENSGFSWEIWAESLGLDTEKLTTINVNQPDYLSAASELWARTPIRVLHYWFARKFLGFAAPYLSSMFVDENFDMYSRTLAGVEELRPRWKRGLGLVEGLLGESLGRLYVAKHFPSDYKAQMEELVANLIEAYRVSIKSLTWMGEDTRKQALEKLDSFTPKIGYPTKWRDYSKLTISSSNSLLENIAAAGVFETEWNLNKLGKEVDREEWFMTPQTVNAYYNPLMNEIVFPAAILQPPFFNPEADAAVNYAGIGAVIGHEIGHGFDDQGSQFDAKGELKNWWTDQDRAEFETRTKALIEQYDQFSPAALGDENHVNGALTIGENIGDLGGLTIAWKAWVAAAKAAGYPSVNDVPTIDDLTGPERFFTSWARIWRGKNRDEFAQQLLAVDPHSPAEFRCNGVLANFDEFAQYYDVQEGDKLWITPTERVHIW